MTTTTGVSLSQDELAEIYVDLHAHPELGLQEHRTAGIVAEKLRGFGYEVTEGVGGTGVVGILQRGDGPTVLLRADMDGLPVTEQTGLDYASVATAEVDGRVTGVMHACGHDVHITALLGAAAALVDDQDWAGRIMAVFQPAEEPGSGAKAMIDDGLFDRFGTPVVVLGQHVAPMPAGSFGLHAGVSYAASEGMTIIVHGKGGHGSRPETTVDPIVLGANIVTRLQQIVSREIAPQQVGVVTVGAFNAGQAPNVIPETAELQVSTRSFDPAVHDTLSAAIERIAKGEAAAAGAPREPEIVSQYSFPLLVNDPDGIERLRGALTADIPGAMIIDQGVVTGSEDVGAFATAAGVPCVYWVLGGADPALFADAKTLEDAVAVALKLPSNHSPKYAPVIEPTLTMGVAAMRSAARAWLTIT